MGCLARTQETANDLGEQDPNLFNRRDSCEGYGLRNAEEDELERAAVAVVPGAGVVSEKAIIVFGIYKGLYL